MFEQSPDFSSYPISVPATRICKEVVFFLPRAYSTLLTPVHCFTVRFLFSAGSDFFYLFLCCELIVDIYLYFPPACFQHSSDAFLLFHCPLSVCLLYLRCFCSLLSAVFIAFGPERAAYRDPAIHHGFVPNGARGVVVRVLYL